MTGLSPPALHLLGQLGSLNEAIFKKPSELGVTLQTQS